MYTVAILIHIPQLRLLYETAPITGLQDFLTLNIPPHQ
jgi:hypothetical protein